jgi:hypothetical protein
MGRDGEIGGELRKAFYECDSFIFYECDSSTWVNQTFWDTPVKLSVGVNS